MLLLRTSLAHKGGCSVENLEFLKTLSAAIAPSGREDAVAKLVEEEIAPFCDEIRTDKVGNLIAVI